jgi:hypothetical protein
MLVAENPSGWSHADGRRHLPLGADVERTEGEGGTVGGGLCPRLCALGVPGAGGPPRVRTPAPVRRRATRRYASTGNRHQPSGQQSTARGARNPKKDTGALPRTRPSSEMDAHRVISSPGQASPAPEPPGRARSRCARPRGQALARPGEPGASRRVPDRGDDAYHYSVLLTLERQGPSGRPGLRLAATHRVPSRARFSRGR